MTTRKRTILLIALMVVALCLALAAASYAGKGCCKKEKDQKITVDQLPPAVKATLDAQAQGCTVTEIEKEVEDGVTVYSADIVKADGTKFEVKIAEDGTLLPAEIKDKDKDGDEDEQGVKEQDEDDEAGEAAEAAEGPEGAEDAD